MNIEELQERLIREANEGDGEAAPALLLEAAEALAPLAPEVQEAVELAKHQLAHFTGPKYEKENKVARALLKVVGHERK